MSSRPWLPESATECADSASIEDEPVMREPMNLATAMPTFAASAATMALVPPEELMSASSCVSVLLVHAGAGGEPDVRRGEVEQRDQRAQPADQPGVLLGGDLADADAAPGAVGEQLVGQRSHVVRIAAVADQDQPRPGRGGLLHPVPEQVVGGGVAAGEQPTEPGRRQRERPPWRGPAGPGQLAG